MGNGLPHRMGNCECKCPAYTPGEGEAQVPVFENGTTSFVRKSGEAPDLSAATSEHTSGECCFRHESKPSKPPKTKEDHEVALPKGAEPRSANANREKFDSNNGEMTTDAEDSDGWNSSRKLSPRCKIPVNPNKTSPVPKLTLPSNVYQESPFSKQGRALRGAAGARVPASSHADQAQFVHLPKLPNGWIRVRSKSTGAMYYCYTATGMTTFVEPTSEGPPLAGEQETDLPPGWHLMVSRSSGKPYYWNAELNRSQFEHPSTGAADPDIDGLPTGWVRLKSRSTGRPYYFNGRLQLSTFKHPSALAEENRLNAKADDTDKQPEFKDAKVESVTTPKGENKTP